MSNKKQNEKIKCLECEEYFKKLGGGHLEKIHGGMTVRDYKIKHPGSPTASELYLERQRKDNIERYKSNPAMKEKVGKRTFDFISNPKLKRSLRRDIKWARACRREGLWKPCIVLYGAIIEAILIEMNSAEQGKKVTFESAINWAEKNKIIPKKKSYYIHVIRDLRNYVHIHKELEDAPDINESWTKTFAKVCETVIDHFKHS